MLKEKTNIWIYTFAIFFWILMLASFISGIVQLIIKIF